MKASPFKKKTARFRTISRMRRRKVAFTSLGLGLVTDVGVLVAHADHDGDMAGTADDGGEDGAGSVVSGETALCQIESKGIG